jgi:hypothetical protein
VEAASTREETPVPKTAPRATFGTAGPVHVPYPEGAEPAVARLGPDGGYFLLRIHSAQAAYTGTAWGNFWRPSKQLLVTSRVQLHPVVREALGGIQVARRLRGNQVLQLGLRPNLIDLVPTTVERVSVALEFLLDRKDRLKALAGAINTSNFLTTLSLSEPVLATAKAVGSVAGQVLDAFLDEADKQPILEFTGDLNVGAGDIPAGYHVLLASTKGGKPLPRPLPALAVQAHDLLAGGKPVTHWSYVVLEVRYTKVRGRDATAPWDVLLREAEDKARQLAGAPAAQRKEAWAECQDLISRAQALLRVDPNYLPRERGDIIASVLRAGRTLLAGPAKAGKGGTEAVVVSGAAAREVAEAGRRLGLPDDLDLDYAAARYDDQVRLARAVLAQAARSDADAERLRRQIASEEQALPDDDGPPAST